MNKEWHWYRNECWKPGPCPKAPERGAHKPGEDVGMCTDTLGHVAYHGQTLFEHRTRRCVYCGETICDFSFMRQVSEEYYGPVSTCY